MKMKACKITMKMWNKAHIDPVMTWPSQISGAPTDDMDGAAMPISAMSRNSNTRSGCALLRGGLAAREVIWGKRLSAILGQYL